MKWTLVKLLTQTTECERFVEVLFDKPANRLHSVRLSIAAGGSRTATQAGAIARLLGLVRGWKKLNILPTRPPRGARWAAIHAGARDSKHKLAVTRGIACDNGIPPSVVRGVGRRSSGRVRDRVRHRLQAFRCEYGIGCHSKESLRRKAPSGLSESCVQSKLVIVTSSRQQSPNCVQPL